MIKIPDNLDVANVEDIIFSDQTTNAQTTITIRKLKLLKQYSGTNSTKEAIDAAINFYLIAKSKEGGK